VLCADLAYNEQLVPILVATLRDLVGPATVCLFSMELRTQEVIHALLKNLLCEGFAVSRVPRQSRHPEFAAPSVVVFALRRPESWVAGSCGRSGGNEEGGGDGGGRRGCMVDFDESHLRLAQVLT
jgi:hypothetical protein